MISVNNFVINSTRIIYKYKQYPRQKIETNRNNEPN